MLGSVSVATAAGDVRHIDPELKRLLREAAANLDSFEDRYVADVWVTDMAGRLGEQVADPEERVDIIRIAHQEAERFDLEPELVLAVIDVESAFDRFAISVAGARGLMQIMPFWLDELDIPDKNLFTVRTNLRFGCTILRFYMNRENQDLTRALARYNGSVGKSWYPELVLAKLSGRWFKQ